MHHFIFPTKTAWISSGSNVATTAVSQRDQNFGQDEVLELKKEYFNLSFDHPTRTLVLFNISDISNSMDRAVSTTRTRDIKDPKFYLRLYEAQGNKELSTEYKLAGFAISQSWEEGTGKFGDSPKNVVGCSWNNRDNIINGDTTSWYSKGVTVLDVSQSIQSFENESSDINVDVTDMVNMWLQKQKENYGILIKLWF